MDVPDLNSWWLVVLLLIGVLYLYITRNHGYWKKRGVPYVKPLPMFGNIKDAMLLKKSLGEVHQEMYWKLDGYKYGGIFGFGKPILMVRDPEMIKSVLVKDFGSFHNNELFFEVSDKDIILARNPFILRGERWKATRSLLTPAFTGGKVKPYFPLIAEVCEEFNKLIEKEGPEFEAKELCARFTTDVVATCAFGIRGNALEDPNCEFRRIGRELLEPDAWKTAMFLLVTLVPLLAKITSFEFISQKAQTAFVNIIREVVSHRRKNNLSRPDYLQYIMSLKKEQSLADDEVSNGLGPNENIKGKYSFTDEDIASQAATFFIDGYETSSAVLAFALYSLAVNPDVQEKVRNEVDSVMKKFGNQISYDAIQEMIYLDMALQESLRMYPPLLAMSKICTKPFKMETPSGGVYEVEVGTPVAIPVYAIHYDPQYYPDPHRYDPERFSEENKKTQQKCTYMPFGEGPRICLGMRFALMQVKAGIASVLSKYEVRPNKKTPVPVVLDPKHFILAAKGGLWLDFVKRTDI